MRSRADRHSLPEDLTMPLATHVRSLALALVALLLLPLQAAAFETRASAAWIYDHGTRTVIFEHNADIPQPPASMSKLMTLNMLLEALQDGRVNLDTTFSVSTRARLMGGSRMFLDERQRPTVEDLIRGIIVHSGNDATVVVAEGLAGTEEAFARMMTERARTLGMTQSTFMNSSGWPHPQHRMSMRDLGLLTVRLIEDFPEYYQYFNERSFTWSGITQANRNPLLGLNLGADGLKTGFTSEAGYGLSGSAVQGGRRVSFVINGLGSERERLEEAERVLNWAFRQFVERTLFETDRRVATAPVWLGAEAEVGLVVADPMRILVPALSQEGVEAEAVFEVPLVAPLTAGQVVGELVVRVPELGPVRVPLLVERDVAEGGFMIRLQTAAEVLGRRILGEWAGL
jgi:serine-type D-Ala-D-Ala carboxypeptidase (penicillin-binding protein 5/6)